MSVVDHTGPGTCEIFLGGQTRTLQYGTYARKMLQKRIGQEPLAYVLNGGGIDDFCSEFVFVGLYWKKDRKLSIPRVCDWFDDFKGDLRDVQKEFMYCYARSKPGDDGLEMVEALDELFEVAENEGPLESDSPETSKETTTTE